MHFLLLKVYAKFTWGNKWKTAEPDSEPTPTLTKNVINLLYTLLVRQRITRMPTTAHRPITVTKASPESQTLERCSIKLQLFEQTNQVFVMVFARMPCHVRAYGLDGSNIVHTIHGTPQAVHGAREPRHSRMENWNGRNSCAHSFPLRPQFKLLKIVEFIRSKWKCMGMMVLWNVSRAISVVSI